MFKILRTAMLQFLKELCNILFDINSKLFNL